MVGAKSKSRLEQKLMPITSSFPFELAKYENVLEGRGVPSEGRSARVSLPAGYRFLRRRNEITTMAVPEQVSSLDQFHLYIHPFTTTEAGINLYKRRPWHC